MTTVASWNVNSLKVRLAQLAEWLAANPVDVIGLQETKLTDENFPQAELEARATMCCAAARRPTTALRCCRENPWRRHGLIWMAWMIPSDAWPAASSGGVRYINVYVPNGQAVGSDKYEYKLRWLRALHRFLREELTAHPRLVVMGDFNIAPDDRDVHDPHGMGRPGPLQRAGAFRAQGLLDLGLADTFRLFEQPAGQLSAGGTTARQVFVAI